MATIVRTANEEDTRAIARIHVDAWRAAYRGHVPDDYLDKLDVDLRVHAWKDILTAPGSTLLAVQEDDTVGFCHLCQSRDGDADDSVAEITSIYVSPLEWHSGVGRTLCTQALRLAESAGFAIVTLWVLESNQPARSFYEEMGFTLDGAGKTEERGGVELREVRYRHTLD